MRYKIAILTVFALTLLASSAYAEFSVTPRPFPYEDVLYKEPKDSGKTYDFKRTLTIYNKGDELAYLTSMTGSTTGLGGTNVVVDPNYVGIPPNQSRSVDVIFQVPLTLEEGRNQGTVDISASSGVVAEDIPLEIVITYPEPRIVTEWEYDEAIRDFKVIAGASYVNYLYVSEYYGYKSTSGVNLTIVREGPANVSYGGELGNISAGTTRIVRVNVTIPGKGLVPGEYEIIPNVRAEGTFSKDMKNGKYIIPDPVLSVNTTKIDFGRLTFEAGKDSANASVEIMEAGGYTPIEGLEISVTSGEVGWLSYPRHDYISPNGSARYDFLVFLPVDASLGQKEWILDVSAPYVTSEKILARTIVYFPGIDAAIEELQNLSISEIEDVNSSSSLVDNTIKLLRETRGKVEIREVAMSMSIYSGTKTLLTKLDASSSAIKRGELVEAGEGVIRAKSSLNKIKVGDENLEDETLKRYSSVAVGSAESLWSNMAREVRGILEAKGAEVEDTNYRNSALYYKQVSELYSLEKRSSEAELYAGKQKMLEERYSNALDTAMNRKFEADKQLNSARDGMLEILGGYLILNPLNYDYVSESYKYAAAEYAAAAELYTKAGEIKNRETIDGEFDSIKREWRNVYLTFIIYGAFLVLLTLMFIARVSLGIQRYNDDEKSEHIGEIFVQG